jgi:glycine/D-amino acid oxidase-like deaminating enzyme
MLIPALGEAELVASWAGFRPATPDQLPILGRAGPWQNAFLATGHFRHGILLGPVTAAIMSDLVLIGRTTVELTPFDVVRFAPTTVDLRRQP